jgi:hypothetical protein
LRFAVWQGTLHCGSTWAASVWNSRGTIKEEDEPMSDNILQTLQHLDVIAPDVRELKVRVNSLEKLIEVRFNAVDQRFDSFEQKMDARFEALMSAITESRAQTELSNVRLIAALSERVAVLEVQRH